MNLALTVKRIRKMSVVARHRRWASCLPHGVFPSVEHLAVLRPLRPSAVVDVGANRGQFAVVASTLWPDIPLLSFEPLSDEFDRMNRVMKGADNFEAFQFGLSDENGVFDFYRTRDADSSSLLKPGAAQLAVSAGSECVNIERVEVRRGDSVAALATLPKGWLLKIDVQGAELSVLKGLGVLLENSASVYCECSFDTLYERQALAHECIAFLADKGLHLAGIGDVMKGRDGRAVQADLLFAREGVLVTEARHG